MYGERVSHVIGINAQSARSIVMANVNVDVDLPLPKLKESHTDAAGIILPKVNCEMSCCRGLSYSPLFKLEKKALSRS